MKCVICRHGETAPVTTTITFERGRQTLLIKHVPAQVCANCGEAYVSETDSRRILAEVEQMAKSGVLVGEREY